MSKIKKIGILGTGDYARALAKRLLRSGYQVIMGSRDPDYQRVTSIDEELKPVKLETINNVLSNENIFIVFLAVHSKNFTACLAPSIVSVGDKILIDISNQDKLNKGESNAEKLAETFPGVRIVKAFNTLSAYVLESDTFGGTKQVLIASNDQEARDKVSALSREMGFTPIDYGTLRSARELEAYPLTLMYGWGWPTILTFVIFVFWNLMLFLEYWLFYRNSPNSYTWNQIPLTYLNKPVCLTAITLLALSYLPGCLAAFLQIINGTKYKRFPNWFDRWLKARKMTGLFALFFSLWHVAISGICMSPGFLRSWFESTKVHLPENTSDYALDFSVRMNVNGEGTISVGLLALLLMSLLGLSSLPSVGAILNWREWRFVQSHMGYVTLFLVTSHAALFAWPTWMKFPNRFYLYTSFMCCVIPSIVLFMKMILITPCIGGYVDKIRGGWEKGRSSQMPNENVQLTNVNINSEIPTV